MSPLGPQRSSNTTSHPGNRSSERARKRTSGRANSLVNKTYPRGPPITAEERLFFMLNDAEVAACPLVAADDILSPLFNDTRNRLQVRTIGRHQLSQNKSSLLKESFRTAFSDKVTPDYLKVQAEIFIKCMQSHGIINTEDQAYALSNLAVRYSRLKHSSLTQVSHGVMNGKIEARIVAKAHIPRGTLLLELGGLMSVDAIQPESVDTNRVARSRRKCSVSSIPAFETFSVIWKANVQYGPGPKKDRLLLGPARFVNHSCAPNCRLIPFPKTHAWGVETCKDVQEGEELTVSYGDHYFAPGECACAPCLAASGEGRVSETPSTSLAPSPKSSSIMEDRWTEYQSRNKRSRPESDVELDLQRPIKKGRR